jgi:hypothetical protein
MEPFQFKPRGSGQAKVYVIAGIPIYVAAMDDVPDQVGEEISIGPGYGLAV